jgi:hypothetical protein
MTHRMTTRVLAAAAAALLVAPASQAALATYTQSFEGLTGTAALSGVGFKVYGTVFDGNTGVTPPYGALRFSYGPFPAPNGGAGFSAIATGEGGVPQGLQYLNVYSDYNCCTSTNQGHFDGTAPYDYVQSTVYQEQTIGAADIGTAWTLTFDTKQPSANGCGTLPGDSVCIAFIKTLDATNNTTNLITFDATTVSNASWSTHVLAISLSDPLLSGQRLQFGFTSTSRQFHNTGVFYDNLSFAVATDTDGDGVPDVLDNCKLIPNPTQLDANGDGYGNQCDADLDNNGSVTATDFAILRGALGKNPATDPTAAAADLDVNGSVTATDFAILRKALGSPPGPSGLHPNCPPTCP